MRTHHEETGQVLVQMAIVLVVLLGAASLAIDVGRLYRERRQMQNAADAGALAGGRALCLGLGDAAAKAWAADFRARNGGEGPEAVINGGTVTVRSQRTSQTFLARAIGVISATVRADASALCGCASGICGAFPVTYQSTAFWDAAMTCGTQFLLWDSADVNCIDYNCEGMLAVATAYRAWADFSAVLDDGQPDPCDQTGCGASELIDRVNGGICRSYIKLDSCMAGDGGVKSSAWAAVEDLASKPLNDRIVRIPLWDTMGCIMPDDPGNTCGSLRYHITESVCVEIVSIKTLKQYSGGKKAKVVVARVVCSGSAGADQCLSACGGASGTIVPGCIRAVSLIR